MIRTILLVFVVVFLAWVALFVVLAAVYCIRRLFNFKVKIKF